MRALRVCRFIALPLLLACVVTACGSSDSSNENGNGGNGANGTAAGGPDLGGVAASSSGGSSGSGDPQETCAGELIEAKGIPLDMYVMLDSSGSMLDATEGDAAVTKWQAVSAALSDFVNDPQSAGIGIGCSVFPWCTPRRLRSARRTLTAAPSSVRASSKRAGRPPTVACCRVATCSIASRSPA